ncbi:class I SAM-dependent methyltransferase [Acaryochloris sp. 'Moss Beach']|uniref:class I SAM-dependent methyltransferase n=1 Tax=Acaryochloris sp. 'Moss Beach' TaxID=2740837 RepID=UPI001F330A19|nr:class I SAM-dependent methyltransferase [Acaryochloris sp. 'Moss Beach']UJB67902.1 class I SAM-dependent methyltransferase [Acaryochloris sp. 'Moss Beach']
MSVSHFSTWEEAVGWLISQPEKKEIVKACYYDAPLEKAADRYWQSAEWSEIRAFCPDLVEKALDIGAGNGIASYALARDGWLVEALEPDISDLVGIGAIRRLSQTADLPINVVQEFGEKLPFPDTHFQLVFARQVLHHAQDLPQLCREVYRVLKPGGVFIAVRDHVISSKDDLPQFLASHPLHKIYGGENAFLLREYIEAIEDASLDIDQILKPLDSVINYAPHTIDTIKEELTQKISRLPGGTFLKVPLLSQPVFPILMKLLAILDNRPGRAFSFIAHKAVEVPT